MIENADIPGEISCARARIPAESSFSIQRGDLASLIVEEQSQRDRSAKGNGRLTPNHLSTGPEMREQSGWETAEATRQAETNLRHSPGPFRYGWGCEPIASPRWMRGRGMAVILIPDFSGELVQRFPWHVSVFAFQPVDPGHELVTFPGRERQRAVFQFSHTHR